MNIEDLLVGAFVLAAFLLLIGIYFWKKDNEEAKESANSISIETQPTEIKPVRGKLSILQFTMILVLFIVLVMAIGRMIENSSKANSPVSDISYFKIVDNYENLTKVRQGDYASALKGTHVRWYGVVDDVNQDLFTYHVWVYPTNYTQDETRFYFDVPITRSRDYFRGQNIIADGYISEVGYGLFRFHVKLNNVSTENAPYQFVQ